MHIISSFSKSHYILFTEIHICSSQINTINPSPQINTICFFRRYTQCIIFSDRHTISSFQIYKLYFLHRNTHIFFSDKHTIFSLHKCTLYPLHRIKHYNLFAEKHIISFISLYSILTNTHYILSSDKHTISLHRNAHILFSDEHN
jgi:hypothetical protein